MRRSIVVFLAIAVSGCSLKKRAVDTLADVLGEAEAVYLSDEDPELIAAALPFNLKTMETLLQSSPEHRELLLTATKSFLLYAYGFVEPEAREVEVEDFEKSETIRRRAAHLYLRAYRYGLRGLELEHPGLGDELRLRPEEAVSELEIEDVPFAVWTAAALGGAIQAAKDDPELTADIAVVGALLERALALDEDFDDGSIHEFLMTYEAGRVGGSLEKARAHYERALALGPAKRPSIWIGWAESFSVADQDRREFLDLVDKAIAFDTTRYPATRLLNALAQRRARWLRASVDELFLDGGN